MLAVAYIGNLYPLLALHNHGYLLQVINYEDLFTFRHKAPSFLLSFITGADLNWISYKIKYKFSCYYLLVQYLVVGTVQRRKNRDNHQCFGSGSVSQGSGSGTFYHQAKIVWKTLISAVLWLFIFEEWCKCTYFRKVKSKIIWHLEGHWGRGQDAD